MFAAMQKTALIPPNYGQITVKLQYPEKIPISLPRVFENVIKAIGYFTACRWWQTGCASFHLVKVTSNIEALYLTIYNHSSSSKSRRLLYSSGEYVLELRNELPQYSWIVHDASSKTHRKVVSSTYRLQLLIFVLLSNSQVSHSRHSDSKAFRILFSRIFSRSARTQLRFLCQLVFP